MYHMTDFKKVGFWPLWPSKSNRNRESRLKQLLRTNKSGVQNWKGVHGSWVNATEYVDHLMVLVDRALAKVSFFVQCFLLLIAVQIGYETYGSLNSLSQINRTVTTRAIQPCLDPEAAVVGALKATITDKNVEHEFCI